MKKHHPLYRYARRNGSSVEELAAAVGCTKQNLYSIIDGKHRPSWPLVARIVEVTKGKVKAADFMPRGAP